jgi:hypothetical protein
MRTGSERERERERERCVCVLQALLLPSRKKLQNSLVFFHFGPHVLSKNVLRDGVTVNF